MGSVDQHGLGCVGRRIGRALLLLAIPIALALGASGTGATRMDARVGASDASVDATRGPGLMPVGHFGGSSLAVAATANRIYAGQGPVLAVYQPTGDGALQLLGESAPLPGLITEIEVAGGLLALAFADDVQDPNNFDSENSTLQGGLALMDVKDAESPRITAVIEDLAALAIGLGWAAGEKDLAGTNPGGVVVRQMVMVLPALHLATDAGLISLDISDPKAPRPLGLYPPDGQAAWGLAYGRRLLYANTGSGLAVLDMADPSQPKLLGCGTDFGLVAESLERAREDRAAGKSRAKDSNPTFGRFAGRAELSDADGPAPPEALRAAPAPLLPDQGTNCQGDGFFGARLAMGSDMLYLSWFDEILILSLRRPTRPDLVGFGFTSSTTIDIVVGSRWLYSLGNEGLLEVLDAGTPEDFIAPIGQLDLPGLGARLSVVGDRVYAATREGGLRVIDIAERAAPREIGALIGAPHPRSIELADGRAYVVDGYSGLQIYDLADPLRPRKLGAYRMPQAQDLRIDAQRAYLLSAGGEVRVLDLSRPARPRELGALNLASRVIGMAAADGLLYAGLPIDPQDSSGQATRHVLSVLDASLPARPRILTSLDVFRIGGAQKIALHGGRLYALGFGGLAIFDRTDPRAPTALGTYYLPRGNVEVTDLGLAGDRAYIALGQTGLVVVDVSEPRNPVEVGVLQVGGRSLRGLAADGDELYVADRGRFDFDARPDRLGISLLDMTVPNRARRLLRREGLAIGKIGQFVDGQFFDAQADAALARSGDILYLADSRSGIQVFRRFEGPRVYLPVLLHP